jgi:hypothetical protein
MTRSAARTTTGAGAANGRAGPAHAPRSAAPKPEPQARRERWRVQVSPARPETLAANQADAPDHLSFDQLRRAAALARPLPFRAALEQLFGQPLPQVDVRQGKAVDAALDRARAEAAIAGLTLFLRQDARLATVAHEVMHLLQKGGLHSAPAAKAEAEALNAEARADAGRPLAQPQAGLAQGATALRDQEARPESVEDPAQARDSFRAAAPDGQTDTQSDPAPSPEAPAAAQDPAAPGAAPAAGGGAGAGATDQAAVPTFEPPPMPELAVDTDAAAAAAEQGQAALDSAEDADQVLKALQDAPPSVKAQAAGGLQDRVEAASAKEQAGFNDAAPDFEAGLSGVDDLPAPQAVAAPGGAAGPLEDGTPPPPPDPEVDPTPDPGTAKANEGFADILSRFFGFGEPSGMGETFRHVATKDDQVETSAGARPAVPLEGELDPARTDDQQSAAAEQAESSRAEAAQAVLEGPGPEQVDLQDTRESFALPEASLEPLPEAPPVEGPQAFADKKLDAETTAIFDAANGPAMAASLAGAQEEMGGAVEERDTGRDAAMATAEAERKRLDDEANAAQHAEVGGRRQDIQDARQTAVDDQAAQVDALNATASTERAAAQSEIDTQVQTTNEQVEKDFSTAEEQAQSEVNDGNAKAEGERKTAEDNAEEESWWDRAADWVGKQFDKLTSAINAIFDAVRAAVKGIIDAVKSAALALIDLAAKAIKSAIDAFATLLHGLVDALLAEAFPEIAAALNAAIDTAANAAKAAVDVIANGLRAGITMLLDALAAGLDAILAAYQAAVNAALALARAALSGDWRALARLILTPILMALGISPEGFFTLMDRAEQALDTIIDDPGAFVSNLLESVKGGIGLFADHFPHHLVAGIILWLTGPLGRAIQMPKEFDLWGILDIARQLVGLTMAMLRRVAVRVIGEKAVARIEFVMNYVSALIRDGWKGLWEQLTQDLGQLRDMVLDQIKTFLLEKIVVASILWLASVFNPVGALVKLVMTIWNFIQFLRTQLAQIYPVVELVINTMADIAAGALEGPKRGVETVLGRMLPVVIDLLMRLLGVGGVPERVQEILRGVQEKVEATTESLMRRVLALFGVKGQEGPAAAPGEIMAPISFSGGGEAHTLLIEDEGETVRPVIRSTPTPLVNWLDARMGQPFDELATKKGWKDKTLANKRTQAQALIMAAKAEEAALDASAEDTENAINAAAATNATPAQKAAATAKVTQTGTKGQATKSAVLQVLEFWGIAVVPLAEKYSAQIGEMDQRLGSNFRSYVLRDLDVARYTPLDWSELLVQLPNDAALNATWSKPANSTGAARAILGTAFTEAVVEKAQSIANDEGLPGAADFLGGSAVNPNEVKRLFGDFLAERLNEGMARTLLIQRLLAKESADYAGIANALHTPIAEAVRRMCNPDSEPDFDIKDRISGSTYFNEFEDAAAARGKVFTYYQLQKPDGTPAGTGDVKTHPLPWFLQPSGGSPRAGANRARVSDAIRDAKPGMHEWIPASIGYAAITATAESFKTRGNLDAPSGIANFVEFQNRVRTPTTDLIFKPGSFPEVSNAELPYVSRAHHLSGKPYDKLTPAEKTSFYPDSGPKYGKPVPVLQAHAGGLRARAARGETLGWTYAQNASPRWHINLQANLTTVVAGNVEMRSMREVRRAILAFYAETIWSGKGDLPSTAFDVYQLSGGGAADLSYGGVKGYAGTRYQESFSKLVEAMNEVLDS